MALLRPLDPLSRACGREKRFADSTTNQAFLASLYLNQVIRKARRVSEIDELSRANRIHGAATAILTPPIALG